MLAAMRAADFDYHLPAERIAQTPAEPRDSARLLVVHRATGTLEQATFRDIGRWLQPGDVLVANDSRVLPARLHGHKADTGGAVEVLLLRPVDERTWAALVRGRVHPGSRLAFATAGGTVYRAEVVRVDPDGARLVRFDAPVDALMAAAGDVPLPPYIHTPLTDPERYQTVYGRVAGSAAAPTAGLHFTPDLIAALSRQGVRVAFVTLHVGLDTFRPLETDDIAAHVIHAEWCTVPTATVAAVNSARARGGCVVAVGTTAVRVLETAASAAAAGDSGAVLAPFSGWTSLYITPGHHFRAVDALITNFHLPRSTLLVLVAAFMGKPLLDRTYATAIADGYRFYSFGDATLVL
jgi:S-adenosylmethionine:tRNA ribosyltransferase-isomerase